MIQPKVEIEPVAEMHDITRQFRSGSATVHALRGVDLRLLPGELVALRGRSGAGKTTLLHILVGLDNPTAGTASLLGRNLASLDEAARARLRRERVGILFQNAHLFPLLTARENVELALRLNRAPASERRDRAAQVLGRVGLSARAHHRGLELSGGEQQRVALARALVHAPQLIVADEPTGNLDTRTAREIVALLRDLAHAEGIALLVATHDAAVVTEADRVVEIADGRLTAG